MKAFRKKNSQQASRNRWKFPSCFQLVLLEYDVTPLIKKYNFDLSKLDKAVVGSLTQASNGKLYGLARNTSRVVDGIQYRGLGVSFRHAALMPPASVYYNIANTKTQKVFQEAVAGGKDVNTALREADERINTKIAQEKAK
jgi:hypothetical protein